MCVFRSFFFFARARFVCVWLVFTCVTARHAYAATRRTIHPDVPRRVYAYFSTVYQISHRHVPDLPTHALFFEKNNTTYYVVEV